MRCGVPLPYLNLGITVYFGTMLFKFLVFALAWSWEVNDHHPLQDRQDLEFDKESWFEVLLDGA